jgi:hypothetical protein
VPNASCPAAAWQSTAVALPLPKISTSARWLSGVAVALSEAPLVYTHRGCAQGPPARDWDETDQLYQVAGALRSF